MIITIGGQKGGTGKTTLVTALAVLAARDGQDVLLVDTDQQGSANAWAAARDDTSVVPRIPCVAKYGRHLIEDLRELEAKYDLVLVDAGGRDSVELRMAMVASHRLFIPVTPGMFDAWTLQPMADLVAQAQALNPALQAWVVINRAHPSTAEGGEAWEGAGDIGLDVARTVLFDRVVHRYAVRIGQCAAEYHPEDRKASAELRALYREALPPARKAKRRASV